MSQRLYISAYTKISGGQVAVNGEVVFEQDTATFGSFIKSAIKQLEIDYPKFYKMDNLSKLAFAGAEYLLEKLPYEPNTAVVLMNKSGSLDTDMRHQARINDAEAYYPSPAVFVYTLANICIGELCIRHQFMSENVFFVSESYDVNVLYNYSEYLLQSGKAKRVICGWVELFDENYEGLLYTVEANGILPHTSIEIDKLFLK